MTDILVDYCFSEWYYIINKFTGVTELTKLIIKLFIDNKQRDTASRRLRFGVVGGACGIAVNLLLALFKALAGILFNSIALVADAVNNMTDAASSVITLIGFKLAAKKPDSDHPYGHGRIEYISGLVMSFIVLMLGVTLVKNSALCIISPDAILFSWLTVVVLVVSILAKLWLSFFYKKLEKETGSKTFAAASADSRNDTLSTFAVLVSVLVFKFTSLNIDGITGLAVSVFIVISGIGLIKETIDPLLGQPPTPELVEEIHSRTLSYDGIIGIHDLVVHNYGPGRMFASLHAEIPADADLLASHDLVDNIEREFMESLGLETVIHIDPVIVDDPFVNKLKAEIIGIVTDIDKRMTIHDFRAVTGPTHTNVIFDVVLPCDCEEKQVRRIIDEQFLKAHPDCFTVITFDRSYV